jgi:penicillin-binding protein 2
VSGNSLYLYLDSALQNKLAEELAAALVARRLVKAAAVIIDPNSGGVLSLVSLPGFDNNLFSGTLSQEQFATLFLSEDQPLFNRAISGQYPSGSSIKPLIASAALEEGIIDRETTFNSTGGIYYDTWFFPDWKAGGHGQTNVVRALAESVNTFFYLIGIEEYDGRVGLGLDGMLKYLHKYNFGAPLGIDLPGEASGFLPDRYWKWETKNEPWYPGDTMHLAIGQGDILVTPLQMANYVAAVANGGTLYQPRLVWEKELKSTDVRLVEPTKILDNQVVSQESLAVVREGMRAAVTWGSARLLNSATYQAAGKTGTAQVGGDQNTHSWFVGFAPYDNPQIAWAIIIENGGEGSDLAVPIMKKVLDWYFSR